MSFREPVDRRRIEQFLKALAKRFREPGRLYLVGGTTLVLEGLRAQTLDIDIAYEVNTSDHSSFIQAVRELKDQMDINVEEASPGDFIPLPEGFPERSRFIGRYRQLDVFHIDFYSMALSKIERGQDADFADFLAMLKADWINFHRLLDYFNQILPRVAAQSLKADPIEFQRKFDHLAGVWLRET